ncbi:MAG: VWA domain-containing protein [candidate division KSB1 bacterium]|nr:VWA domain-containing protein [candidate division KSB1 bacterium]MDZ7273939.1 VWA domain-containing protein [candidate division KSB1 bacterium]MDZ7286095.1 VWA domain-containing protein [candidate division KSB1 bacterium]MDZ7299127.1 VWA domain-containing protein [candidate division KSB1 bacterium]MDZ7306674.1 VWA domain-containing protein [candidate division KSB1 bacterium]
MNLPTGKRVRVSHRLKRLGVCALTGLLAAGGSLKAGPAPSDRGRPSALAALTLNYNQVDATAFPTIVSYLAVIDQNGATVGGLTQDHFVVREDGTRELPIIVEETTITDAGVTMVLTLDRSGSMEQAMPAAKQAASTFVNLMRQNDQAAVVSFSTRATVDQTFTNDKALLHAAINAMVARGGTAIYDALLTAANLLTGVTGRKAIILMTDGEDKDSNATLDQVVQRFSTREVPVYAIGLDLNPGSIEEANLVRIAAASGGKYFYSPSTTQLEQIYREIALLLRHSYKITYRTHNRTMDGTRRQVRIEVNYQGMTAAGNNSYVAPLHVPTIAPAADTLPAPMQAFPLRLEIPATSLYMYNLHDLRVVLRYDKRYLKVKTPGRQNIVPLGFFGQAVDFTFTSGVDTAQALVMMRFKRNLNLPPAEGRGGLAQITFLASAALPDSTPLRFEIVALEARDETGWPVAVQPDHLTLLSEGLIVWPGDTNHNGVVELTDVTVLGVHWGRTGAGRPGYADLHAWQPQIARRYPRPAVAHADANGSGLVEERDLFPIGLNWRKSVTPLMQKTNTLTLAAPVGVLQQEVVPAHRPNHFRVLVKFENHSNDLLAGLAFRMDYSNEDITVVEAKAGEAWGSTPLVLQHDEPARRRFAMSLIIPAGEPVQASRGTLAEITVAAATPPRPEQLALHQAVVVSPTGGTRELEAPGAAPAPASAPPREFFLHAVYPNPFALSGEVAAATLRYDLPENAAVSLEIFNNLGQRVRLITSTLAGRGRHVVPWDGRDDRGHLLNSGLYLLRFEAAGESGRVFQATQKLMLLR